MAEIIRNTCNINISGNNTYWVFKRLFDIVISVLLIPVLIVCIFCIFFLNYFYNRGSILFIQKRMGKNCKAFYAIKFRTMSHSEVIYRKYSDPLELNRITKLGNILRKTRIDELPQILNVLKGEMSLIGPRPEYYEHALLYIENLPNYTLRYAIRPGISGLSQIRLGYAQGIKDTKKKLKIDLFYIENASFYIDLKIFIGTILIVFKAMGN
jgi:lipopolysaccharide/colanic/teichoic acid biosynthesis glycosyltransferase